MGKVEDKQRGGEKGEKKISLSIICERDKATFSREQGITDNNSNINNNTPTAAEPAINKNESNKIKGT